MSGHGRVGRVISHLRGASPWGTSGTPSGCRSIAAVLGAVVVLAAVSPASAGPIGSTRTPATEVASYTIDHTSRDSVRQAYRSALEPAMSVPIGWNGSVGGCVAGSPSTAAQEATLNAVNFFRQMAALPPVALDPSLSSKAQAAALMMQAKGSLSHSPDPSWPCYTTAGAQAAGVSNLCLGCSGATAVAVYMDDPGTGNYAAGHRRWVLYPPQQTMGSGSTSGANALTVIGGWGPRPSGGPTFVPWPSEGYFPVQIEPNGRWSLTADGDVPTDFSQATVTVSQGGMNLPVVVQPVVNGYGDPTIVWDFDPAYGTGLADRAFTVTVDNILRGGTRMSYGYTVTLFDANVDLSPPGPTRFSAVSPKRLLDTRDGSGAPKHRVGAGASVGLQVAGNGGRVPEGASAVVLNVTGVAPSAATYVSVSPHGGAVPTVSNLNLRPGEVAPNLVTVRIGDGGAVDLFNAAGTIDLVADLVGYYSDDPGAGGYRPVTPKRLLDTRYGTGAAKARVGTGSSIDVAVLGGSTTVPSGALGVVLNVTGVAPTEGTYVTVFPAGEDRPVASNLNLRAGEVRPNLVTAKVGEGGRVSLYNAAGSVDLVADVVGYYSTSDAEALSFVAVDPQRIYDSRDLALPVAENSTVTVDGTATSSSAVPEGARALVVNTTITEPSAGSFFTVYPAGVDLPLASSLNFGPGQTIPNLVICGLSASGEFKGYNALGRTHVVYDVAGYFTAP